MWNDREILFALSRGGNEVLENSVYEPKKKNQENLGSFFSYSLPCSFRHADPRKNFAIA